MEKRILRRERPLSAASRSSIISDRSKMLSLSLPLVPLFHVLISKSKNFLATVLHEEVQEPLLGTKSRGSRTGSSRGRLRRSARTTPRRCTCSSGSSSTILIFLLVLVHLSSLIATFGLLFSSTCSSSFTTRGARGLRLSFTIGPLLNVGTTRVAAAGGTSRATASGQETSTQQEDHADQDDETEEITRRAHAGDDDDDDDDDGRGPPHGRERNFNSGGHIKTSLRGGGARATSFLQDDDQDDHWEVRETRNLHKININNDLAVYYSSSGEAVAVEQMNKRNGEQQINAIFEDEEHHRDQSKNDVAFLQRLNKKNSRPLGAGAKHDDRRERTSNGKQLRTVDQEDGLSGSRKVDSRSHETSSRGEDEAGSFFEMMSHEDDQTSSDTKDDINWEQRKDEDPTVLKAGSTLLEVSPPPGGSSSSSAGSENSVIDLVLASPGKNETSPEWGDEEERQGAQRPRVALHVDLDRTEGTTSTVQLLAAARREEQQKGFLQENEFFTTSQQEHETRVATSTQLLQEVQQRQQENQQHQMTMKVKGGVVEAGEKAGARSTKWVLGPNRAFVPGDDGFNSAQSKIEPTSPGQLEKKKSVFGKDYHWWRELDAHGNKLRKRGAYDILPHRSKVALFFRQDARADGLVFSDDAVYFIDVPAGSLLAKTRAAVLAAPGEVSAFTGLGHGGMTSWYAARDAKKSWDGKVNVNWFPFSQISSISSKAMVEDMEYTTVELYSGMSDSQDAHGLRNTHLDPGTRNSYATEMESVHTVMAKLLSAKHAPLRTSEELLPPNQASVWWQGAHLTWYKAFLLAKQPYLHGQAANAFEKQVRQQMEQERFEKYIEENKKSIKALDQSEQKKKVEEAREKTKLKPREWLEQQSLLYQIEAQTILRTLLQTDEKIVYAFETCASLRKTVATRASSSFLETRSGGRGSASNHVPCSTSSSAGTSSTGIDYFFLTTKRIFVVEHGLPTGSSAAHLQEDNIVRNLQTYTYNAVRCFSVEQVGTGSHANRRLKLEGDVILNLWTSWLPNLPRKPQENCDASDCNTGDLRRRQHRHTEDYDSRVVLQPTLAGKLSPRQVVELMNFLFQMTSNRAQMTKSLLDDKVLFSSDKPQTYVETMKRFWDGFRGTGGLEPIYSEEGRALMEWLTEEGETILVLHEHIEMVLASKSGHNVWIFTNKRLLIRVLEGRYTRSRFAERVRSAATFSPSIEWICIPLEQIGAAEIQTEATGFQPQLTVFTYTRGLTPPNDEPAEPGLAAPAFPLARGTDVAFVLKCVQALLFNAKEKFSLDLDERWSCMSGYLDAYQRQVENMARLKNAGAKGPRPAAAAPSTTSSKLKIDENVMTISDPEALRVSRERMQSTWWVKRAQAGAAGGEKVYDLVKQLRDLSGIRGILKKHDLLFPEEAPLLAWQGVDFYFEGYGEHGNRGFVDVVTPLRLITITFLCNAALATSGSSRDCPDLTASQDEVGAGKENQGVLNEVTAVITLPWSRIAVWRVASYPPGAAAAPRKATTASSRKMAGGDEDDEEDDALCRQGKNRSFFTLRTTIGYGPRWNWAVGPCVNLLIWQQLLASLVLAADFTNFVQDADAGVPPRASRALPVQLDADGEDDDGAVEEDEQGVALGALARDNRVLQQMGMGVTNMVLQRNLAKAAAGKISGWIKEIAQRARGGKKGPSDVTIDRQDASVPALTIRASTTKRDLLPKEVEKRLQFLHDGDEEHKPGIFARAYRWFSLKATRIVTGGSSSDLYYVPEPKDLYHADLPALVSDLFSGEKIELALESYTVTVLFTSYRILYWKWNENDDSHELHVVLYKNVIRWKLTTQARFWDRNEELKIFHGYGNEKTEVLELTFDSTRREPIFAAAALIKGHVQEYHDNEVRMHHFYVQNCAWGGCAGTNNPGHQLWKVNKPANQRARTAEELREHQEASEREAFHAEEVANAEGTVRHPVRISGPQAEEMEAKFRDEEKDRRKRVRQREREERRRDREQQAARKAKDDKKFGGKQERKSYQERWRAWRNKKETEESKREKEEKKKKQEESKYVTVSGVRAEKQKTTWREKVQGWFSR
ncbi:unnamed protein product [Amoebophrya sp. A120]|nr:unnamed protein product [Amoebophrya sp. A120]|eukprot:GSA120T00008309001.1